MSPLNDLHGKVPPPPVHVVPLGSSVWDVQTINKPYVRLATCRDRNVADYIAALWNLMPAVEEPPKDNPPYIIEKSPTHFVVDMDVLRKQDPKKFRRRKAGKSIQVMP